MGVDGSAGLSRRHVMRLAATGLGVWPAWRYVLPRDAVEPATAAPRRCCPDGAVIRTILDDLNPDALGHGTTLFHEHLSRNLAPTAARGQRSAADEPRGLTPPATRPGNRLPLPRTNSDLDRVTRMVLQAGGEGVTCIVDSGHTNLRRRMADLRTVAERTGMHIVASGGFYMARTRPMQIASKSAEQIADELVREIIQQRLGTYGEIGTNPRRSTLTRAERTVFRAIGIAHARTGVPIVTHDAYGTEPRIASALALRQLDVLESVGVPPGHVAIGRTCCLDEPDATGLKEIARRGAFVGYDRVTTARQIVPDETKAAMVLRLLDAGHADRLLLSADFTGSPPLDAGTGDGRTMTAAGLLLRSAGVGDADLKMLLQDNPRRFLAFVPKHA
jgi:phosphotriesterase-related protein